ncbi:hypothetical protein [Janthinobacterium sp. PC23-8]|uniref:hypothetical protein n=1 Tax=Janthinobacterium sp. PC23-8 TaxID=2012679 RepID=UPI00114001E2|nr:hypothetical protein [Janthinobacterium sp. PC23-8]
MFRASLIAVTALPAAVIVFYAGVFSTSFNSNMCYSSAMHELQRRAQAVAASKDPAAMEKYAKLMQALPLHGYETSCDEIKAMLARN